MSGSAIPGAQAFHFLVSAADSTLRGLAINGGFTNPVRVEAANFSLQGCFIGTDVTGMTASAGGGSAALVQGFNGATSTTIGGPSPADRNLIAAHGNGIFFDHVSNGTIQGNLIGTDATGSATLGAIANNCIGISTGDQGTAVRGNVLASAGFGGITIGNASDSVSETIVQGNFIGTDVTGTIALGNGQSGIHIWTTDVIVGGTGPGEGNAIAFNKGAGVLLIFYAPNRPGRCTIRGNSIYSNHYLSNIGNQCLGIDFQQGVPSCDPTLNDLGDGDTGPNGGQNFPIITSAVSSIVEGGTTITGRFNSAANTTFTLDFYGNAACAGRPQDFREGETYLGSADIVTDGSGNAAINVILPVTLDDNTLVTATATDPDGDTSEFSQRIVLRSTPGAGPPTGAPVTLDGFHFLAGATVAVGAVGATNVNVASYNQITATAPSLPPGSLNDVTVTNTDGSAGTLPNGWIADFLDVPGGHIFYQFVTTLVRNAITVGVGGGNYGAAQDTLRQQMAVFLLKARFGICYTPPPCTVPAFPDVPCSSIFAPWINELVVQGITGGCAGGNFCPTSPVNRQQMAVFLLKAFEGSGYIPPACTVATFADVPCSHQFAPWIYELVARNITAGCGGGNYCPGTSANRGQIATFLVKTFGLQ